MSRDADVIVIGAGAAGLSAARTLQRAQCNVLVLEAAARTGGRVRTVYPAGADLPIELGAEFLHGDAQRTRALLAGHGLRHVEGEGAQLQAVGGRVARDPQRFAAVGRVLDSLDRRGGDRSLAEWLEAERPPGVRARVTRFVEGFHAADARRVSVHALAEEGGDMGAVRRTGRILAGQSALLDGLAAELDARLRLDTPVHAVRWRPGDVAVHTSAGTLRSRAVIVTASIGVLQSGALRIEPLPRPAAHALRHLAMGDVVRIAFVFSRRFWEEPSFAGDDAGKVAYLHTPDARFNVWWTQHPVSSPLLVAWAGGPRAAALLELPAAAQAGIALAELARAAGLGRAMLERECVLWETYDWSADPLVRGAYSYPLVGGAAAAKQLARTHAGTLAFAGEATAEENGTVEGALTSGERAARSLLRSL